MRHTTEVDYLIIGAGPAGLQAAYFLQRAGLDYQVLERNERAGTFFETLPRQGKMISINKVYTGYDDRESQLRYDWNSLLSDDDELAFTRYTPEYFGCARLYAKYLQDYAARLDLNIRYQTSVALIDQACEKDRQEGWRHEVTTESGERYLCKALVVATGMWTPYVPDIPGVEHADLYTECSMDPADYANDRLLIIGKGNSGFETANDLVAATRVTHVCSPHSIKMAWKTHFFGHLRAVNNDFLDTYILKGQNSVLDATVDRIVKEGDELVVDVTFTHAEGQRAQFAYDKIILCTGFRWDPGPFAEGYQPETTACKRLPKMTSAWESTNLPHVYFAGTLMQMRDHHKTMSNVLHGFRFNIKSLTGIFQERYEATPYPAHCLPRCPEALADKVIERVSTNAGLMHQPGFLSDVIVVDSTGAHYHETLAVDYVRESRLGSEAHYYIVTMEYGDTLDDLLAVNREPDPEKAYNDFYLHPRIRRFSACQLLGEHHMSESLENEWRLDRHPGCRPLIRKMEFHGQEDATQFQQTHRDKLVAFFQQQLALDARVATHYANGSNSHCHDNGNGATANGHAAPVSSKTSTEL